MPVKGLGFAISLAKVGRGEAYLITQVPIHRLTRVGEKSGERPRSSPSDRVPLLESLELKRGHLLFSSSAKRRRGKQTVNVVVNFVPVDIDVC